MPSDTGKTPPAAPMTDIHGLKPALPMGRDLGWLLWAAAALLVLAAVAALVWWLRRRRRKADPAVTAPSMPAPEVEAYARLDALAAEQNADLKLFYYRLSAILRHYMERRFEVPAAEMTTEELLPIVVHLGIEQELGRQMNVFCRRADPIKFAGAAADRSRLAHELAFVRDFVRRTTPALTSEGTADEEVVSAPEKAPKQIAYQ